MFVVGICAGNSGKLETFALPGLASVAADCETVVLRNQNGLASAYNEILALPLVQQPGVEGLILMHDDVELRDGQLLPKLREAFADPSIGVVGVIGGRGVRSLRWWDWSPVGRVEETRGILRFSPTEADADSVDGMFLALSSEVLRSGLRFDSATFDLWDGYDVDFCFEVRRAGWRVVTRDLDLVHHTKAVLADSARFDESSAKLREKWGLDVGVADRLRRAVTRLRARFAFTPSGRS